MIFFFFNVTATTEIYTLSLHDALPIFLDELVLEVVRQDVDGGQLVDRDVEETLDLALVEVHRQEDRKSTRLNSSHGYISYAVFCLKKKINLPVNVIDSTNDRRSSRQIY